MTTEQKAHREINELRDKLTTAERQIVQLKQELKDVYPNLKQYCDNQLAELEEHLQNV